jgi:DNA-binding LacI/PurR family transcriptional regulator
MGEREGFKAVTRHLLDTGRRRLAVVWPATASDWDRRASGLEAMTGLLASGADFDAVMGVNDAVAIGALRALRAHGVRVPDDVALTGFDDTDEAEFTVPPLTTVSPEHESMVDTAVRMLVERLSGGVTAPREFRAHAHLIPRASSGVPR